MSDAAALPDNNEGAVSAKGSEGSPRQFRKRVSIVTAVQWTGDNAKEVTAHAGDAFAVSPSGAAVLWIEKSQAWSSLGEGTWVVAEQDGSGFYPVTDDVWQATYDEVV